MKKHNLSYQCFFCRQHFSGNGNNIMPYLTTEKCCDNCNKQYVIPMRVLEYYKNKEQQKRGFIL